MDDEGKSAARDQLEAIRTRAYYLWLHAGRPSGGDLAFWEEARQQIEAESAQA